MILSIKHLQFLVYNITFLISFVLVAIFSGVFQAWVAYQAGDDTAKRRGFLSLDPLVHVDFLGLLAFYLLSFGWTQRTPINFSKFRPPFVYGKYIISVLAKPLAYFIIAFLSMFFLVLIHKTQIMHIIRAMFECSNLQTTEFLTKACPIISTHQLWLSFLLIQMLLLAVILGSCTIMISFIRGLFSLFSFSVDYSIFSTILYIFFMILLLNFMLAPICIYIFNLLTVFGYYIALLL